MDPKEQSCLLSAIKHYRTDKQLPTEYPPDRWLPCKHDHRQELATLCISYIILGYTYKKIPLCVKAVFYCPAVLAGISLVFSWKGAGRKGGSWNVGLLRQSQMWKEDRTLSAETFFLKVDSLRPL